MQINNMNPILQTRYIELIRTLYGYRCRVFVYSKSGKKTITQWESMCDVNKEHDAISEGITWCNTHGIDCYEILMW